MKKKVLLGLIIFLIAVTVVSNCFAATSKSLVVDADKLLVMSEKIKDAKNASVFEAKTVVNLEGDTVYGNVFIFGRDVTIKSEIINGDLFVCAQNVEIDEETQVNGNAFIAVASAKINGSIERELYVASSELNFGETASVGYDALIGGEHVVINGTFERNVNAGVTEMEVKEDTIIAGDLNYASGKEATISEDADIKNVNFSKQVKSEKSALDIVLGYVLDFARYFVVTMVLLIIVIKKMPNLLEKIGTRFSVGSFGTGILGLILIPIAIVLFLILNITTTVAWALLATFILMLILSMAISNIALAKLLETKKSNIKLPIWTAIVTIATWGIYQIPVVGGIVAFVWVLLGLGIVIKSFFSRNKEKNVEG